MEPEVTVGIIAREDGPLLKRALRSLREVEAGLPHHLDVEIDPGRTSAQNRNVVARRASSRYLCMLDDDSLAIQAGWLSKLLAALRGTGMAAMGPLESKCPGVVDLPHPNMLGNVVEVPVLYGFCILLDMEPGITWDDHLPHGCFDDIDLSLALGAAGHPLAVHGGVVVYHSSADLPGQLRGTTRKSHSDSPAVQARRTLEAYHYLVNKHGVSATQDLLPQELIEQWKAIKDGLIPWQSPGVKRM